MEKTFHKPTEKDLESIQAKMEEDLKLHSFYGFQQWLAHLNEAARVIRYLPTWHAEDFIRNITGETDAGRIDGMAQTIKNQWDMIESLRKQVEELTPDLQRYEKRLKNMDWYYTYSDDIKVWRSGEECFKELQEWSKKSPEHQALWEKYKPK